MMDESPTDSASELDSVLGWSLVDSHGDFEDDDSCSTTSSVEVVSESQLPDIPAPAMGVSPEHSPQPMFVLRLSSHQDMVDSDDENIPSNADTRESQSFDLLSSAGTSSLQRTSTTASTNDSYAPSSLVSVNSTPKHGSPAPVSPISAHSLSGSFVAERPMSGKLPSSSLMSTSGQFVSQEDLDNLVMAIDRVQSALPEKGKSGVPLQQLHHGSTQDDDSVISLEMFGDGKDEEETTVNVMDKSVEQKIYFCPGPSFIRDVQKVDECDVNGTNVVLETLMPSERPRVDLDEADDIESSVGSTFSFLDRDQGMEVEHLLSNTVCVHREDHLDGETTTDQDLLTNSDEPSPTDCTRALSLVNADRRRQPVKLRWQIVIVAMTVIVLSVFMIVIVRELVHQRRPMTGYIQQKKFDKLFDELEECKNDVKVHKVNYEWQGKQLDICRHRTLGVLEEQLKDTIDNYENILQNYRGQLTRASQENANLKSDIATMHDVHAQFNLTQRENLELRSEITMLKNVVSEQEHDLARMERDTHVYDRDMLDMKQELIDQTAEMASQNETLVRRKDTILMYRVDLNQVRQENADLRSEVMKLKYTAPNLNDNGGQLRPDGHVTTELPVLCYLPPEQGPCESAGYPWYYNPEMARCEQFLYGGCEGNDNRFGTKQLCQDTCTNKTSICLEKLTDMQTKWTEDKEKLTTAISRAEMWHDLYMAERGGSCDQTLGSAGPPEMEVNVSTCWRLLEQRFHERIKDLGELWPTDSMEIMFNYFREMVGHGEPFTQSSDIPATSGSKENEEDNTVYNDIPDYKPSTEEVPDTHFNGMDENQPESSNTENDENQSKYTGSDENESDFWMNILNKTKQSVFTVGDQIQNTWQKVKDASENLMVEHKPALVKLHNSFSKKIHEVTEKFQEKLNKKVQKWFGRKRKYRWEDDDERKQYQGNDEDSNGENKETRWHSHHASSKRPANSQSDETTHDRSDHRHKAQHHHGNHHHDNSQEQFLKKSIKCQNRIKVNKCQNRFKKLNTHTYQLNMKKFRRMDRHARFDELQKLNQFNERFGQFLEPAAHRWLECQLAWWRDALDGGDASMLPQSPLCLAMLACWQDRVAHGNVAQCKQRNDGSGILDDNLCLSSPNGKSRHDPDESEKTKLAGRNINKEATGDKQEAPDTAGANKHADWLFARAAERQLQRDTHVDEDEVVDGNGDEDDGVYDIYIEDYDDVYVHTAIRDADELNDL